MANISLKKYKNIKILTLFWPTIPMVPLGDNKEPGILAQPVEVLSISSLL